MNWPEGTPLLDDSQTAPRAVDCDDAGILNIVARFYNDQDIMSYSASTPCSQGSNTVTGMKPGTYRLSITGEDSSGTVLYKGERSGIEIQAGIVTVGGEIQMSLFSSDMALIPSGCFDMGDAFKEGSTDEPPVHNACITSDFYMDVHEVTNAEYAACVSAGECTAPKYSYSYSRTHYYGNLDYNDFPVIWVSWNQASDYCNLGGEAIAHRGGVGVCCKGRTFRQALSPGRHNQ